MLEQLNIKKLGLIDSAHLNFSRGLIVISGETGAGKTLLLDGLVALTGFKPASADMVDDDTFIEGIFDLSSREAEFATRGVELDDGHLYIARQFPKDGKSKASLQAKSAPSALLRELSELWIAIHGQHDTYRLLNPKTHLAMLDEFGGNEISSLRENVSRAFRNHVELSRRLKALQQERETALSVAQTLREDVELCLQLAIQPDEDTTIAETIRFISDSEAVSEFLRAALESLDSDEASVASGIARALSSLEKISHADSDVASVFRELSEASELITQSQSKILRLLERVSSSESDVDALMQRQQHIKRLLQKYGPTTAQLSVWLEDAERQLQLVDIGDEEIAKLQQAVSGANQELIQHCQALHDARVRYAGELESAASRELHDLALSMARFEIEIKEMATTDNGFDAVEFLFSANPGMKLSPLQDSASGGELSRLMLALEVSLLKDNSVPVMIFDEIDSGVAGATALSIAKKLVLVSQKSQVFVVSHLPQIAAFADQHFVVRKTFNNESTMTEVLELGDAERISELARMLAGLEGSDSARDHAEELLEKARAAKASLKK
jgi:DNA repair protein RecN (Recombination protein N)